MFSFVEIDEEFLNEVKQLFNLMFIEMPKNAGPLILGRYIMRKFLVSTLVGNKKYQGAGAMQLIHYARQKLMRA